MPIIPGYEDGFDATTVEPSSSFDPIPRGKYIATIVKSEVKETKKKDGHYLNLHFRITEGPYEGRMVFTNLNLQNPSAEAQRIAQKQFSAICHATGVLKVTESSELHGIPLGISVKINPGSDVYPPSNDITGYFAADSFDTDEDEGGDSAPW